jgi:hypothetical protein
LIYGIKNTPGLCCNFSATTKKCTSFEGNKKEMWIPLSEDGKHLFIVGSILAF